MRDGGAGEGKQYNTRACVMHTLIQAFVNASNIFCLYLPLSLTHIHVIPFSLIHHVYTYRLVVKEIVPPAISEWRPLVVMANPRSGGNDGPKVLGAFRTLLNPVQVRTLTIR